MEKLPYLFKYMSLGKLIECNYDVTSASYSVLSKFITLSSHAWSIISAKFRWEEISSLIYFFILLSVFNGL